MRILRRTMWLKIKQFAVLHDTMLLIVWTAATWHFNIVFPGLLFPTNCAGPEVKGGRTLHDQHNYLDFQEYRLDGRQTKQTISTRSAPDDEIPWSSASSFCKQRIIRLFKSPLESAPPLFRDCDVGRMLKSTPRCNHFKLICQILFIVWMSARTQTPLSRSSVMLVELAKQKQPLHIKKWRWISSCRDNTNRISLAQRVVCLRTGKRKK